MGQVGLGSVGLWAVGPVGLGPVRLWAVGPVGLGPVRLWARRVRPWLLLLSGRGGRPDRVDNGPTPSMSAARQFEKLCQQREQVVKDPAVRTD